MGRPLEKLSALQVERFAKKRGMYGDGGGLWLCVSSAHASSWVYRYQIDGRAREMGLGPYPTVSLAGARERAREARRLKASGIDPIIEKQAKVAEAKAEAARAVTFRKCAEAYISAHRHGWKNAKHAAQWGATLEAYVYPTIGDVPAMEVDVAMIHSILEPIWSAKAETASRVRGRMESILDWATARGYRRGENPARWKGHLENLFPARSKVRHVSHHAALPYREISDFMTSLRRQEGMAARALEFTILTATRTGEVREATWDEFNLDNGVWTIPAGRMKAGREHRVPLTKTALALLETLRPTGTEPTASYIFAGSRPGKPLSNMAMLQTLRRMNRGDLTVHGFRSTFRDWTAEQTSYPNEVAEAALAHTVGNKVEAAYRRSDLFEKRKRLMADWAEYCAGEARVVPLRRAT